ncbi:hypothetical protein BH09CHL1_BH09CHL1_29640 [soil metagenome]
MSDKTTKSKPGKRRSQGSGSVNRRKSDGRWIAVLDLGWVDGKRKRKSFTGHNERRNVSRPKNGQMR